MKARDGEASKNVKEKPACKAIIGGRNPGKNQQRWEKSKKQMSRETLTHPCNKLGLFPSFFSSPALLSASLSAPLGPPLMKPLFQGKRTGFKTCFQGNSEHGFTHLLCLSIKILIPACEHQASSPTTDTRRGDAGAWRVSRKEQMMLGRGSGGNKIPQAPPPQGFCWCRTAGGHQE